MRKRYKDASEEEIEQLYREYLTDLAKKASGDVSKPSFGGSKEGVEYATAIGGSGAEFRTIK